MHFAKLAVLFVSAISLFPSPSGAEADYYTKENILRFAEYLYRNGEYDRAIGEYLRVVSREDDRAAADSLSYRIAAAYLHLAKPVEARRYCSLITADTSDVRLAGRARLLCAYSYYIERDYDSSWAVSGPLSRTLDDPDLRHRVARIGIAALLKRYRWNDAFAEYKETIRDGRLRSDDSSARSLGELCARGKTLRLKSPLAAGLMSACIPGSGKVYAHRTKDGLFSLVITGVNVWQAYEGYVKDGPLSVRFITFGLLGGCFYLGNIYGSVVAVKVYNRSENEAIAGRVDVTFDW